MERLVHLSIDDVGPSLRYLTRHQPDSLFDLRFYRKLQQWHEQFGAQFCLYCFSHLEDFTISQVPDRYAKEFQENGAWLRFGFHGCSGMPFWQTQNFREEFFFFKENARRLGMTETDILRVHCWSTTLEQGVFLRQQGVRVLLSPVEVGIAYEDDGVPFGDGLEHWRTDVRFEELPAVTEETLRIGAERVVAFTHEWAFDEHVSRIEEGLTLYRRNGYRFFCLKKEAGPKNAEKINVPLQRC